MKPTTRLLSICGVAIAVTALVSRSDSDGETLRRLSRAAERDQSRRSDEQLDPANAPLTGEPDLPWSQPLPNQFYSELDPKGFWFVGKPSLAAALAGGVFGGQTRLSESAVGNLARGIASAYLDGHE